jgi:uncharacterized Zn finger protein (UPF0148 family)
LNCPSCGKKREIDSEATEQSVKVTRRSTRTKMVHGVWMCWMSWKVVTSSVIDRLLGDF